ncbi:MAG: hypothetical protein WCE53_08885 [Candidatus Acidiferrum sp.]
MNVGVPNMGGTSSEVFALTDEQILGMEPEAGVASGSSLTEEQLLEATGTSVERGAAESAADRKAATGDAARRDTTEQAKEIGAQAPPQWLAERMRDPWHGDEAKELWEGAVQARQEAAAYREAIATPAEARALKEIYPGGVSEAKSAAERARQLEEFDAAYFGAAGKPAEALSAARVQLAQRLMEQDPGAFREMVAAGVRLLEASGQSAGGGEEKSRSLAVARDDNSQLGRGEGAWKGLTPEGASSRDGNSRQPGAAIGPQVAAAYVNFEKATNAELEKSVGGAIARAMEQALPNLKSLDRAGRDGAEHGTPLQERLGAAVCEDVEAALKSDAQLGEQVAKILGARRFDDTTRAQVVRVIDARAQQLVPGAVKRVVGSWTTATLGTRGKSRAAEEGNGDSRAGREPAAKPTTQTGRSGQSSGRSESSEARAPGRVANRGRVDYGKLSDEQILEL